jgi:hypothetical protein
MPRSLHRAAAAALAALVLGLAGCSGEKPAGPVSPDKAEALKQEAEQQRQANDRMRHNK